MQAFPFRNEVVKSSEGKKGFWKYALSQHDRKQRDSNISQLGFDQRFTKTESSVPRVLWRETKEAFVSYISSISWGNQKDGEMSALIHFHSRYAKPLRYLGAS